MRKQVGSGGKSIYKMRGNAEQYIVQSGVIMEKKGEKYGMS